MVLSAHFAEFFRSSGDWLHCTAHSHHPWPDVTRAAQLAYWDDAARLTDRKWDKVFGEVLPEAQGHVARHLTLAASRSKSRSRRIRTSSWCGCIPASTGAGRSAC